MINLFAVCKNNFFVKAWLRLLQTKNVILIDTCNQPDMAIVQYVACQPNPSTVLLDANWESQNVSTVDIIRQFSSITPKPTKILLVTNFFEKKAIEKLKPLGMSGYFYRASIHPDNIFQCIQNVYQRNTYFQECANCIIV